MAKRSKTVRYSHAHGIYETERDKVAKRTSQAPLGIKADVQCKGICRDTLPAQQLINGYCRACHKVLCI